MSTYRITLDLDECIGYGRCAELAPHAFRVEGDKATLLVAETDDATALDAAAECPMSAISVIEVKAA